MKKNLRRVLLGAFIFASISATGIVSPAHANTCGRGIGEPPFLSFGVDSNLLLLFDNSGSMLDLAYIDENEQCYDESFDNTATYSGYFDKEAWYAYDFNNDGPFALQAVQPAFCDTADYWGLDASGAKFVCVDLDTTTDPDTVIGFAATGNFINWATATKFDIQKGILTGGKYDSVNQNLQMESRGCMDRRFVKQVNLAQGTYRLVLGVRGPMEVYQTWLAGTDYETGDIVIRANVLYQALVDHNSADKFDIDLAAGKWEEYKETRWYPGQAYPANTVVYDVATDSWHWTRDGGTSLATAIDVTEDTEIVWVPYDGTSIEIFNIVEGGFEQDACQQVIDLIGQLTGDSGDGDSNDASSRLGQIKQLTEECMGFDPGGGNTVETARKASFNHAMQECWYYNKFGHWQPGSGTVSSMKTACRNVYDYMDPIDITPWDSSYVCNGSYQPENDKSPYGYVGRCWEVPGVVDPNNCIPVECPAGGSTTTIWTVGAEQYICYNDYLYSCTKNNCNKNNLPDTTPGDWEIVQDCTVSGGGDIGPDWTNDDFYFFDPCEYKTCMDNDELIDYCSTTRNIFDDSVSYFPCTEDGTAWTCFDPADGDWLADNCFTADPVGDLCVEQAIKDFCGILSVPEVIDPSDSTNATGEAWNAPAYLIDSGVIGQLDFPLATMKGYIRQEEPPRGILQNTAGELRIGAMAFNAVGAETECAGDDPTDAIEKYCPEGNKDGSSVISRIRLGSTVTDDGGNADPADDRTHVDDLCQAINDIRATSWTPLAEAMYTAIGYYTQNQQVRLHGADFQTDADVFAGWTAATEYAPGSYLLDSDVLYHSLEGGTSEGLSLAADTGVEWVEVTSYQGGWGNGVTYDPEAVVSFDGKFYITYSGGTAIAKPASPGGPLYDEGVLWEPLIDPVANWCQDNHVLVITEGASTADISPEVAGFVEGVHAFNTEPIIDPGETDPDDATAQCTDGLVGSTYFDDLVYFARNHEDPADDYSPPPFTLYPVDNDTIPSGDYPYTGMAKKSLKTTVVVAGSLRDELADDECDPAELMQSAADNSGTPLLRGEDPEELEASLLAFFNDLRQRASAGSAASVISSARGGEGAIYQAIFWPELKRDDDGGATSAITWAGDVHGLFLDNRGFMYEDTNGDRALLPYEDIDDDGHLDVNESLGEDVDGDGHFDDVNEDTISIDPAVGPDGRLDVEEDLDGDGTLDCGEDRNCNGVLDLGEDMDGDNILDLTEDLNGNGIFDPGEDIDDDGNFDRVNEDVDRDGWPDVNEDLDGDGRLDCGEDINGNGVLDPGEDIDGDGVLDLTEDLNGDGAFDPFVDVDGDGRRDVREDVNNNGVLDIGADRDRRVIIYYDEDQNRSMACYNTSIFDDDACNDAREITEVNYLWSVNEWLADNAMNTAANRAAYLSNERRRHIFTWNDLNNDGIADANEILPLETSVDWGNLAVSGGRGPVVNDFGVSSGAEVDMIVSWLRGNDWLIDETVTATDVNGNDILDTPQRSRQIPAANGSATDITWRLGDIIHSTPMTVANPAEGYHLIYNDYSYAQFLRKYRGRRHMVYFGGNDGLLHAVNAGFYSERENKFCLLPLDATGACPEPAIPPETVGADQNVPELGAEMWAYLPYNLQPHVKCLADPNYVHKYYVDQRPRIFDAQIFEEESACRDLSGSPDFSNPGCIHPNGWGTILVGGMRFGGTPVRASELNGDGTDSREFASAYFILDITNPEDPPALLGELTRRAGAGDVNLGYTSVIPTMIIMKDNQVAPPVNKWYLLFGSGPFDDYADVETNKAIKGISAGTAGISVLPLDWLTATPTGLRIPDAAPTNVSPAGTFSLDRSPGGFVSDLITVDFDINPSYRDYKSDAAYFGTVQGDFVADGTGWRWDGGGLMYRLVTKDIGAFGSPFGRGVPEPVTEPWQWQVKPLLDLTAEDQPITAAASVGTDGYNFWIYFGTGRFFDADDKTDRNQQAYYGIKEPIISVDSTRYHTWSEVVIPANPGMDAGDGLRGLQRVDEIQVSESPRIATAALSCRDGSTNCLPAPVAASPYLATLERYISGSGDCTEAGNWSNCVDGWYKEFYPYANRERNVGQATLLGGLVTFTTYQPFNDVCKAEGNAYLYGVYYRTGTAWHENIFGDRGLDGDFVRDKLDLGRGLATTPNLHVGSDTGSAGDGPKAFVQTSTGEILEIQQENLPIKNYQTGPSRWKEYTR